MANLLFPSQLEDRSGGWPLARETICFKCSIKTSLSTVLGTLAGELVRQVARGLYWLGTADGGKGEVGLTTDKPMKIHSKPDAVPYCCNKPTVVPLNFRAQVKPDIEGDVMKGILERVPFCEPDFWCLRMVIQEKKNGKATVDPSNLSKHGLEE